MHAHCRKLEIEKRTKLVTTQMLGIITSTFLDSLSVCGVILLSVVEPQL